MNWKPLGLAAALLIAACGGGGGTATNATPSLHEIAFALRAVNDSGASGDGTITAESGRFTVEVRLTGLAANTDHMSHIHKGSCGVTGDVVITLHNVKADGAGTGRATTTISHPYSMPATGWYVNVHAGPDLTTAANVESIACGDLTAG